MRSIVAVQKAGSGHMGGCVVIRLECLAAEVSSSFKTRGCIPSVSEIRGVIEEIHSYREDEEARPLDGVQGLIYTMLVIFHTKTSSREHS